MKRREFLNLVPTFGLLLAGQRPVNAASAHFEGDAGKAFGVLNDLTKCIGCRKCEWACSDANQQPVQAIEVFEDKSIFQSPRRPDTNCFTVVNQVEFPPGSGKPVWVKSQCFHCLRPSCASACIVSAYTKQKNGPVTYDPWRCMGCRYCMVACPFQIPAYEFNSPLTPRIRKCSFCLERIAEVGGIPACVGICPPQNLTFGKRSDLLELAHSKIESQPGLYVPHVYGEHEVGGTSWLYLSSSPFADIGFLELPKEPPPALTETIQHGIFQNFLPEIGLAALIGISSQVFHPAHETQASPYGEMVLAEEDCANSGSGHHHEAAPLDYPFFTPGTILLLLFAVIGLGFAAVRFLFGIGAVSNLNNQFPWGIWIGIDVATGIALAAGGFTTAAIVHVFHQTRYESIIRPALLTALLGYTIEVTGLMVDLGRYYNIWHPLVPSMWSGNSVLFEVGICVTFYLNILYLEFLPVVIERFRGRVDLPGPLASWNGTVESLLWYAERTLGKVLTFFILAGVLLSCLHQSSLGTLMVIAPSKMHPLWFTPVLPLLFLLSAICVGFPMVIFVSLLTSKAFGRKPEMEVLTPLSRFVPIFLTVYLTAKVVDLVLRGAHHHLLVGTIESKMFILEMTLGVLLPIILLAFTRVRRSANWLLTASTLVVLGVAINRINVFLTAYRPPFAAGPYFPAMGEVAITVGLISALILLYRAGVIFFPVLPKGRLAEEGD